MSLTWFNTENIMKNLGEELNKEMLIAAEPLVKKALAEIEREMRKTLGGMLIGLIQENFIIERDCRDIRITVRQAEKK